MHAAAIIWKKQMGKFARNGEESLGVVIQPVLWVVVFGIGMKSLLGPAIGDPDAYVSFMLPGIIALTVLTGATGGGMGWLLERVQGIVKEYVVAPIARIGVLLGNAASIVTKALIQSAIILIAGVVVGAAVGGTALDWFGALVLLLFFGAGFSGIALAAASAIDDINGYHMMIALLQLPMLFLSNALYPLDSLPTWLQWAARLNPASYLVDGLRQTVLNDGLSIAGADLLALWACFAVCAGFAVVGMTLALRAFQRSLG